MVYYDNGEFNKVLEMVGGSATKLAECLGVSKAMASAWARGARPISAIRALQMEALSGGKVKAASLTKVPPLKKEIELAINCTGKKYVTKTDREKATQRYRHWSLQINVIRCSENQGHRQ